ncbi:hypothetical protein [Actinoplanes teichomyceticus]|uniref:Secreted protein n=1 Tax=Actinoplanes teichomyceticus TaxID=1867 RepID=A0A561WPP9_ACTTI|nr:hypothetical protein [Actinoplanes teichomyceticus]TWG25846.1 hypothetical protein FHX34_101818 [Actinoplanes teichomyceticus]GIF10922.1 hypothetical protein Ate01nite_09540 [Actinoplanes teichomyceticus]
MKHNVTRRSVLRTAAVAGAAAAAGPALAAAPASAEERRERQRPETSANGWPIQPNADVSSLVWTRSVAGTGLSVAVWIGDVEAILLHVIRRFHYEVEEIQGIDLTGWQEIGKVRRDLPESNLASGTAVRIRPGARAKGGFFPLQELALRDILADCEGVVRWGGDDRHVDESLFYIAVGRQDARLAKLVNKLRGWEGTPGEGAGVTVDISSQARRTRAEGLARVQRSS